MSETIAETRPIRLTFKQNTAATLPIRQNIVKERYAFTDRDDIYSRNKRYTYIYRATTLPIALNVYTLKETRPIRMTFAQLAIRRFPISYTFPRQQVYVLRPIRFKLGAMVTIAAGSAYKFKSISIAISNGSLSDVVTTEGVTGFLPKTAITFNVCDRQYKGLVVNSVSQKGFGGHPEQNVFQNANATYDLDNLNYGKIQVIRTVKGGGVTVRNINKSSKTGSHSGSSGGESDRQTRTYYSAKYLAGWAAKASNAEAVFLCDNFLSTMEVPEAPASMSYANMLSSVFGWSTTVPWRQINVFLQGDKLYFIQRGKEEAIRDITDIPFDYPTVSREIYHGDYTAHNYKLNGGGFYSDSDDDTAPPDDKEEPFTGTITFGDATVKYAQGQLVMSKDKDGVTTYEYNDHGQLTHQFFRGNDGTSTETTIDIAYNTLFNTHTNVVQKDAKGKTTKTTDTYVYNLGNGFTGTATYEDGKKVNDAIGSGVFESETNDYLSRLAGVVGRGRGKYADDDASNPDKSTDSDWDAAPIDTLPIWDWATALQVVKEINAMKGIVQETVSIDLIHPVENGDLSGIHIYDFRERIKLYDGEYFLDSNNVKITPTSIRQSLSLVRFGRVEGGTFTPATLPDFTPPQLPDVVGITK